MSRRNLILLFAVLAAVHTWPLLPQAATHTLDDGDSLLNTWLLAALARSLATHPLTFFNINAYYPYHYALTTLDHQLSAVVFTGPIYLVSGNPQLALNLYTYATFVFAGVFCAVLVQELSRSAEASVLAGSVFAFASVRLENINHSHVLGNFWLPLALLLAHRYLASPTWRRMWTLASVTLILALTAWYNAVIGPLAIAILVIDGLRRHRSVALPALGRLAVGAALAGAVVAAVALPYARVTHVFRSPPTHLWSPSGTTGPAGNEHRTISASVIQDNSTGVEGVVGAREAAVAPWLAPLRNVGLVGGRFFPGVVAAGFALVAILLLIATQARSSWLAWPALVLAAIFGGAVLELSTHHFIGAPLLLTRTPWFFPALIAAWALWLVLPRLDGPARPWLNDARPYLVMAIVGGALSLGVTVFLAGEPVAAGIYPANAPGFSLLRAAVRFGVLCALGTAVLAGFGYAELTRRLQGRMRLVVAIVSVVLVNVELFAPLPRMRRIPRVPRVYQWLRTAPAGPVVEFPVHANMWGLYWSLYHRQPLVQGYGLVQPPAYSRLVDDDDLSPAMVEHIRAYFHARYIAVDRTKYSGDRDAALSANIAANGGILTRVAAYDGREVYEIGGPSRGAPVLRVFRPWMVAHARGVAVDATLEPSRAAAAHTIQVWGNGELLATVPWMANAEVPRIFAPLPADRAGGVNVEILGDYLASPAEIAVEAQRSTRIQVDGHVWTGQMGYTLAVIAPDGRVDEVRTFNTSWDENASHALASRIAAIPQGWTAAVATNYDASRALTADAIAALRSLGMTADLRGRFRLMHAAIGRKGAAPGTAIEQVSAEGSHVATGTPALVPVAVRDVRIY